ncbi:ABC transporter substrate-binding protein [Cohnella thailandensis]|uniref:ABC transporter substrate-binding protein n=1 Tax=Cohnella thailandensis TaxID=557557 RepID=UPI001D798926|nr:ABC transporter substrate-binding protein [Cohnella thailandensis]MBP1975278.1 iron complex transport system substrate-binding protein [Cohnella thailandensis]
MNSLKNFRSWQAISAFCLAICLVVLAGCSSNSNNEGAASPSESSSASASPSASQSAAPSESAPAAGKTSYPLTIENYTSSGDSGTWVKKNQTFEKAPERVVANTQPIAEMLIRLGLTDKMVGVAALYGEMDPELKEEFEKIPVLSKDYVGKEPVVGANPDLVMGRADLFADADWGVGTVDSLNDLGINTFVHSTGVRGATLDSLYQDISNIGQIFDIQDKAAEYVDALKVRAEALKTKAAGLPEQKFAYVSDNGEGGINTYSGYVDTFQGDVLNLLGLTNAFADVEESSISLEQLIAANPDVLLLSWYTGSPDAQTTLDKLYKNEQLKDINAVKNKKVYVIDFNTYWGYGDQIVGGVEKLADEMTAQ